MKILVVCAHLMGPKGNLNAESQGRCKVAALLFRSLQYDKIIVPGWAYRDDSQINISSKMRDYLVNSCDLNPSSIVEEPRSRDTVGDAVFCRLSLNESINEITKLTVVTSDYHVSRAIKIFKFVFGGDVNIDSNGSFETKYNGSLERNEGASFDAFEKTFSGIEIGDINAIVERLIKHHPFYNGDKYPKLSSFESSF